MKKSKILLAIIALIGVIAACSDESLKPIPLILTVWTDPGSSDTPIPVTNTTATISAAVTSDGGKAVTAYGVCYTHVDKGATLTDSVVVGSSIGSDGSFTVGITGLATTTTYHARAYATNSLGTVYGNSVSFTTNPQPIPVPVVNSTTVASAVTQTTATSGGNVAYGGATITEMGVCVSTTANPKTTDMKFIASNPGAGPFSVGISGLTAGTTYHIRAYAINAGGTGYGNDITFTTSN